jgi:hypothetical protein
MTNLTACTVVSCRRAKKLADMLRENYGSGR